MLFGFLLLLFGLNFPAVAVPGSASGLHKLQVDDPALAGQIIAAGGRLVADYPTFQIYDIAQVPPGLAANRHVQAHDEYNRVLLNAAHLDTTRPEVQALRSAAGNFAGKRMRLVQFAGPVQPAWREELLGCGLQVVAFIPHNAYLVYGDAAALARLQALAATASQIQWEGPYLDRFKIDPAAQPTDRKGRPRPEHPGFFAVQLLNDPTANSSTVQLLERLKLEPFRRKEHTGQYLNIVVRLSPQDLATVAAQPDVVSVQVYLPPRKLDERQDQIAAGNLAGNLPGAPGYLAWLAGKGFTQAQFDASGFIVDVTDSGIDDGTTTPNHFGLFALGSLSNPSRLAYARLEGSPNIGSTLEGCDGHGTLNAHIIGGYDDLAGFPFADAYGYHYGLGICPFVRLGASVIFDPNSFTSPNYSDLQSDAWNSGARISNNSWGSSGNGRYDIDAQEFDALVRDAEPAGSSHAAGGNQEMVMVFAAGNGGPYSLSIDSPATAKNVISVGAAESVQPFGGADGAGVTDAQASSANDMVDFSSRGPCLDGRHKPDLVAPGTHVSGGVDQAPNPGPDGTASACFNGTGVAGGPGGLFWPSGQQFYTASSGTSHSTPAVSGACALVRQYFLNQSLPAPSPAMTKAYLMNSARYLTGASANDTLWSDTQGMGEVDLGMAFDGVPRILRDQVPADLFTASGQSRTFGGIIADPSKPVRVTLAWTDAPGSTAGNAYNNNLDLTVTAGGQTYLGNVFQGAYSTTGGSPDSENNVESVFLPAGVSGAITVQVSGTDINSDGVPNNNTPLDQDFALVVYNASAVSGPVLEGAGTTLLAESCTPTNGAVDPGETVTMSFALENLGTAGTVNLKATLLATNGVLAPSAAQNYGALAPNAPPVSRAFTFTAQGPCGGLITPTLELRDGATVTDVAFPIRLGQAAPFTSLSENFDAVTPPALPDGWSSTNSGGGSLWTTTTAAASTTPNGAFVPDAASVGLGELVSPVLSIQSTEAQLTFANEFDLEADNTTGTAFDGGVLEIKLGDGAFTDILQAGGKFLSGGYNLTIDPTLDNPLAGRDCWSGASGGFTMTTVALPAAAAGQNIQLRWVLGTDTGNQSGGSAWYIDSVSLRDVSYACCPSVLEINNIDVTRTNVAVSINSTLGMHYILQFKNSLGDTAWQTLTVPTPGTGGVLSLLDTNAPMTSRIYRVLAN